MAEGAARSPKAVTCLFAARQPPLSAQPLRTADLGAGGDAGRGACLHLTSLGIYYDCINRTHHSADSARIPAGKAPFQRQLRAPPALQRTEVGGSEGPEGVPAGKMILLGGRLRLSQWKVLGERGRLARRLPPQTEAGSSGCKELTGTKRQRRKSWVWGDRATDREARRGRKEAPRWGRDQRGCERHPAPPGGQAARPGRPGAWRLTAQGLSGHISKRP